MTVDQAKEWLAVRVNLSPQRPGVLATILEVWGEGSPEMPITLAETLSFVTDRFPNRKVGGLLSSIQQAKYDLKMKKGIIVEGGMKTGWYVKEQLIKE
jgi:hypothetical protein